jgi:hypothetical protein
MKRRFIRVLVAFIGVAALGVTAKAQTVDFVVVTVPFQFVVDGQTLPAGTYRVKRLSDDKWQGLLMSSFENRVSLVVHPNDVESAHSDTSKLTFTGDQHFLSQVKTGDNVFNIKVSGQAALLASTPSNDGGNTSGSANGSN